MRGGAVFATRHDRNRDELASRPVPGLVWPPSIRDFLDESGRHASRKPGLRLASQRFSNLRRKDFKRPFGFVQGPRGTKQLAAAAARNRNDRTERPLFQGRRWRLPILIGALTSPDRAGVKNPQSCECGTAEGARCSRLEPGNRLIKQIARSSRALFSFPSHEENPLGGELVSLSNHLREIFGATRTCVESCGRFSSSGSSRRRRRASTR